jgi:hypothetical protein
MKLKEILKDVFMDIGSTGFELLSIMKQTTKTSPFVAARNYQIGTIHSKDFMTLTLTMPQTNNISQLSIAYPQSQHITMRFQQRAVCCRSDESAYA